MPYIETTNTSTEQNCRPNPKYKDSIFVDLLTYKEENILQVCKALGEITEHENIEILRLDNTVYTGIQNDVSCLIGKKLMMLIEHQSTVNPNMPMRCLQYLGRLYENITPVQNRYSTKPNLYPNAQCYTFYNGDSPYPPYSELKLSDLFIDKTRPASVELIVKVFNINYSENNELLSHCPILCEYALFVHRVKENRKDGVRGYEKAIKSCMKDGILEEYLSMKTRVINSMLVAEYDPELHMQVRLEEAREDAIAEGRAKGIAEGRAEGRAEGIQQGERTEKIETARRMKAKDCDIAFIAEMTGLSYEEVESM